MKIRPLSSISTSCAIAMLALTANAAVGTINYPVSAQKAIQTAVSGLDASGWPAAAAAMSVAQPMPTMTMGTTPKTEPVPIAEWIARLTKLTRGFTSTSGIDKRTCLALNLCDGTANLPLKVAKADTATDGALHYFGVPLDPESKDLLIMRKMNGVLEAFLIDKTGKLRAASVQVGDTPAKLITNEQAAEQFNKEMAMFGKEAAGLPPTGTAVAGNS